jgi:peptide/nickel transport system ATP-binding protein
LLAAVPSAREPRLVSGIPGAPPAEVVRSECSYMPRCAHAEPRCARAHPGLEGVGFEHEARCLRVGELGPAVPVSQAGPEPVSGDGRPVLEVRDLNCTFGSGDRRIAAVGGVSLELCAGETLAIVGESGSGKTTLLRAIAGLVMPTAGAISLEGMTLAGRATQRPRSVQGRLQLIFQNPDSSLNPRHDVFKLVRRSLELFRPDVPRDEHHAVVAELLDQVRLPRDVISRRPADLSGGQKQRVAIARAFAARPAVLLCDEVTSALDVSVQATVVELIRSLSSEYGTAVLFVTHDLALVRSVAGRACVMQRGRIREAGGVVGLFAHPEDTYTRELLAAVPELPKPSRSPS